MRKEWGPRALQALVGALVLATITTSSVLATPSTTLVRASIGEGRPTIVTLAASLDRAAVAAYREHARLAAIAAANPPAPVHHKAAPHRRHVVVHHRPAVVNHLWIPALGISRSVVWFPCSRSREPGSAVYRWGCAGRNNVYLFAHAGGAFQALHDAYLNGTLKVGMVATYANGSGHITRYRVTAWKVVSPSDISWSYSLRHLSMTLQTCVGTNSQYRLDVRLESF